MARSLQAVRAVCWQVHGSEYEQALRSGQTFADVAGHAALIGRFREPGEPFTVAWLAAMGYRHAHGGALARFLRLLADALTVSANALPDLVRAVMAAFPELKRAKVPPLPPLPLPMQAHGPFGGAAQQAARKLAELEPQAPVCVVDLDLATEAPEARAVKLARVISLRFAEGRGGCEVAAPGRLDRRAAARGVGMPLRMTLPGRETLRPRVVICLDVSGSMWDQVKIAHARVAAQAVALAVQEGGGEAVGILFHEKAFVSLKGDASLLFASISRWPRGDTSFAFLGDAWRRWPEHRFVLVTDGDGDIPHILERDRERTAGILIAAGDANPEVLGALCGKVVELAAPEDLPWLVAMLIPRVRM
jgi:hypothetical protein